jgi:hypothetical protein
MLHVTFGGFDKVRNQIVPAFKLDVDLRPRVIDLIPQADQRVVDADHEKYQQNRNNDDNDQHYCRKSHRLSPLSTAPEFTLTRISFS